MRIVLLLLLILNLFYFINCDDCPFDQDTNKAVATFYEDPNQGNCGYGNLQSTLGTLMATALSLELYNSAENCGVCFNIFSPYTNKSVVVIATDSCPTCTDENHFFDLTTDAFDILGSRETGVLKNLVFNKVPCRFGGNVQIKMKDRSNDYWTAFLIYGSNIGIKQVSVKLSGSDQYEELSLAKYGYWVSTNQEPGSFEVRIESIGGEFIYKTIDAVVSEKVIDTGSQFNVDGCIEAGSGTFGGINQSSKLSISTFLSTLVTVLLFTIYLF